MEITKREIIFSIAIVCVMLIIGIMIHQLISDSITNKNKEYETAIHIDTQEIFEYGMKTNIGNAFVYGTYIALDPVTNKDVDGEWSYLKYVKKKYTMHTRTITTTDGKGHTHTRVETYWTWDTVDKKSWSNTRCSFLNHEFDPSLINLPEADYIKTIRHGDIKYEWYGKPSQYSGTIYAKLENNTISKTYLQKNIKTSEAMDRMKSYGSFGLIGFWFGWIIIIAAALFGFYYLENKWLK